MTQNSDPTALPFLSLTDAWDPRRQRPPLERRDGARFVTPPDDPRGLRAMDAVDREMVVEWMQWVEGRLDR